MHFSHKELSVRALLLQTQESAALFHLLCSRRGLRLTVLNVHIKKNVLEANYNGLSRPECHIDPCYSAAMTSM